MDILIRRDSLPAAKTALEQAGFFYRHTAGMDVFLDGPNVKARDAVHLIFASEKVRPSEPLVNPDVDESEQAESFRVLSLDPLVQIKLVAYWDNDRVHLRDLIDVGLIDETWLSRVNPILADKLRTLLETPGG